MLARFVFALTALLWAACLQAQHYTVYVIDTPNFGLPPWQILQYDRDGRKPEVFIDHHLDWPHDILFLEDAGTVLVSNYNSGTVERFDAATGQHIDTFASGIPGPTRMKIGPDGLLYVLSASANARVKRFQLDGTLVDDFTSFGLPRCLGLAWDQRGYLYVSSYDLQIVRVFDREGIDRGNFVNTNLNGPANIWFDAAGDLLVLDYDAGVVARFDQDGRYAGDFIQGLSQAEGVDFLPDGTILIGNGGTSAVKSFTPEGAFIEDFVTSELGGLSHPAAVVVRVDEVNINPGMADAWFNPSTAGQGFLVTVFPDRGELFVAWFTYDTERPPEDVTAYLGEPGHRWLTAQGPFEGDTAELTVYLTRGGVFDAAQPPAETDQDGYGTMTVEFLTCREGRVTYDIPSLGLAGEMPIQRIVEDNVALCETLR
jgi:sugar lactone lactonase YvrE